MNPDGSIRPGQKAPDVSKEELLKVYGLMLRLHVRRDAASPASFYPSSSFIVSLFFRKWTIFSMKPNAKAEFPSTCKLPARKRSTSVAHPP
jgi:hypothetical protein